MRAVIAVLSFIVLTVTASAQQRPEPPPPEMRAAPDHPGYAVDARTGCWVWNPIPEPNETVTWSGECAADGLATGRGTVEWVEDGNVPLRFVGEMRDGKRSGRGVATLGDGSRHEGEWGDDKMNGHGVSTWPNGNRYEGEFRDDEWNGRGVWTGANGDRYEGEWRDGKPDGRGVMTWIDGRRYEGDWHDNSAHGRGVETWANGDRYEGEWRDNRPGGYGEAIINGVARGGNWVSGCLRRADGGVSAVGRPLSECQWVGRWR